MTPRLDVTRLVVVHKLIRSALFTRITKAFCLRLAAPRSLVFPLYLLRFFSFSLLLWSDFFFRFFIETKVRHAQLKDPAVYSSKVPHVAEKRLIFVYYTFLSSVQLASPRAQFVGTVFRIRSIGTRERLKIERTEKPEKKQTVFKETRTFWNSNWRA